ncbi:MAG: redoxin domain-containing protein, partial [Chloroflexi bacterium]|nr:redoxin domain-containing protein [Chloroflexota bacterium]
PAPTATPRPTATPVPPTATPNIPVGHQVGQRAPDFTVTAVSGETVTLSEVTASGKAVIVYFFATW